MIDIATHPWLSGLLGDADMAAIFAPDAEVQRLLQVEAAWIRAVGEIDGATGHDSIAQKVETAPIRPDALRAGMAKDGVPIPQLVALLRAHVGPEDAPHVHTGLTSQDVMDTSLTLALKEILSLLNMRLQKIDALLRDLQNRFGARRITAITRMQPGLETSVTKVIAQWRDAISELQEDIHAAQQTISIVQWGGPIGLRDHAKAVALGAAFSRQLDLTDPGQAWHTDRRTIGNIAHLLGQVTNAVGKIAEDFALFAFAGPDCMRFIGGSSSAMAHKNNPVKAEALIACADHVAALCASITRAARHEGFRSGRAWTLEWLTLPQLCVACGAATRLAADLLSDIRSLGKEDHLPNTQATENHNDQVG